MSLVDDLELAAQRASVASNIAMDWATGDASTVVSLPGGGSMPSIQKFMQDNADLLAVANPIFAMVDNITALRALDKTKKSLAVTFGYTTRGDGGGATYYYDAADATSADDGFLVIVASDGGRWKLNIENNVINVKVAGALGNDVADDTAAFLKVVNYVKVNSGVCFIPVGNFRVKQLEIGGATGYWAMRGASRAASVLKHLDGDGPVLMATTSQSSAIVGTTLSNFRIDAEYSSTLHASAGEAIRIQRPSRWLFKSLTIADFKTNGLYIGTTFITSDSENVIDDVLIDGSGTTSVGIYAEYTNRLTIRNTFLRNCGSVSGGGGIVVNNRNYGLIIDNMRFHLCGSAVATIRTSGTGSDLTLAASITGIQVSEGRAETFRFTDLRNSYVEAPLIELTANNAFSVVFMSGTSNRNVIKLGIVKGLYLANSYFYIEGSCQGNVLKLGHGTDGNSANLIATFAGTASSNRVEYDDTVSPVLTGALYSHPSTAFNHVKCTNAVVQETAIIASDSVTIKNNSATVIVLDTEASGATDDIATLTHNLSANQLLMLRNTILGRTVVVKHGATFKLDGGTDKSLVRPTDTLVLRKEGSLWVQVSFSTPTI